MSVASQLRIRLDEYDARIRTSIPGYEQMLDAGAGALAALDLRDIAAGQRHRQWNERFGRVDR